VLNVELQQFDPERHLPLVSMWVSRPHVARWWGDPAHALAEIRAQPADTSVLIVVGAKPVGYICWQRPSRAELEGAGLEELPDDLIDIDLMIGEPDARGRGVGPEALRQLLEKLAALGARLVGLATATANQHALRAYGKAGFRPYRDFVELGETYRYFTKDLVKAAPLAPGSGP